MAWEALLGCSGRPPFSGRRPARRAGPFCASPRSPSQSTYRPNSRKSRTPTDLSAPHQKTIPKFPNVPEGTEIASSPGSTLNFRLPIGTSPGWALFGMLLACLFWNGIVSVFVVQAVGGHRKGDPDWFMTLFISPFVLVGMVLIVIFVRKLLVATGIGPTLVEISDHPLHPGDQCRLFVSQPGRLRFNSLEVLLVCEEKATYRQGTNTRTENREVYQQAMFRREGFEIHHGLPFETQCELAIPVSAMHSFRAEHNEVNWTVVVKGDVAGWPDYRRVFPIVVQPTNGRTDT